MKIISFLFVLFLFVYSSAIFACNDSNNGGVDENTETLDSIDDDFLDIPESWYEI